MLGRVGGQKYRIKYFFLKIIETEILRKYLQN
mgnify:CR=1 FL=1